MVLPAQAAAPRPQASPCLDEPDGVLAAVDDETQELSILRDGNDLAVLTFRKFYIHWFTD